MPGTPIGGIPVYTLIYAISQPMTWDLGTNRLLTFQFGDS